jgi:hypothetical protein
MQAIQRLRQLFGRYYSGKSWGRAAREEQFIELCLRDARLIPQGFGGLRFNLRDLASYTLRSPSPQERSSALGRIAKGIWGPEEDSE